MTQEPFFDSGFALLKQSKAIVSPIATVFFNRYTDQESLRKEIALHSEKIQVIVSAKGWFQGSIPFGKAQLPEVNEFADHLDTMKFLVNFK